MADLCSLPREIHLGVASFLPPQEVVQFSTACRSLHSSLNLSIIRRSMFEGIEWYKQGDDDRRWSEGLLPTMIQSNNGATIRYHSVSLSFYMQDQGWGNRKGQVHIVASNETNQNSEQLPFDGGRVVYASDIAQHEEEAIQFTFVPRKKESYYLWYKVGAGGGHTLSLREGKLRVLVFDMEEQ